jgi:hypothetical protein
VLMTLCFSALSVHSIIGAMGKTLSNILFLFILLKTCIERSATFGVDSVFWSEAPRATKIAHYVFAVAP